MFHEVSTNLFRDERNSEKIHRPHNLFMAVLSISFAVHSSMRTTIAISGSIAIFIAQWLSSTIFENIVYNSPVRCAVHVTGIAVVEYFSLGAEVLVAAAPKKSSVHMRQHPAVHSSCFA